MRRSVKIGIFVLAIAIAFGIFVARQQHQLDKSQGPYEYKASTPAIAELQSAGYIGSKDGTEAPQRNSEVARKIIQNGYVSVLVKHYDPFLLALQRQLAQEGGYVSNLEANRSNGKLISARIIVRIPSARTNIMVSWLHEKGEVLTEKVTAEDVSEEYYDTQARLTNAKRLESRLIEMVKNNTGKLEDLILLEEKIGEIRGQIEQMEGRMRTLDRLVSLATLTIDVQVQSVAVAYQPPTFASRLAHTWKQSTEALGDFLKGTALLIVGVLPWIPVAFAVLGLMLLVYRMAARISRKRSVES
jgi:hypothetical protein